MCGIAGFIDFHQRSSSEILQKMTDTLSHRGPDGGGYEYFELAEAQVGLGHRRLSIIDLSAGGTQPMQYKNLWISFNGEIYNFQEIKLELTDLGHSFRSTSDTEVILHAYEEWGTAMVQRLIGMFTIVLFDKNTQNILIFRDRAGVKPLYYYWDNELFLFASELKAFHQHAAFKKNIHKPALQQFIKYGFILAPQTIFENTYKLLPGHYLSLSVQSKTVTIEKYWDIYDYYNKPLLKIDEQEALLETERLLKSSVLYRTVSDVPIGVFLSGGYDSTAVTALLQSSQSTKIKTFTIGSHDKHLDEAPFAKQIASYLGTDHTEYHCTTQEAQDIIKDIPFILDEPMGDSSIIPSILVSRLARQEVKVALSADAGDEIFGGYNKYPLALNLLKQINQIPSAARPAASKFLKNFPDKLLSTISGKTSAGIKKNRLAAILATKNITACTIMDVMLSQVYTDEQLSPLFNSDPSVSSSYFDSEYLLNPTMDSLNKMLAMDYKTYLMDDILVKVDRATMSASLEGREPLLDHRLVEFTAQLPSALKIKGHIKKYALKQIVHKYIPEKLMDRPKMGFSVPIFDWLRTDLRTYLDEFTNEAALSHGYFNIKEVERIKNKFYAGNKNYDSLVWYIFMFQMWYAKWMQ
jgi:asparagine synthase (glutamine-hydrolysing)